MNEDLQALEYLKINFQNEIKKENTGGNNLKSPGININKNKG